jgi:hypothetical protein
MSETYTTYHSTNAKPEEAWIAYINGWKVRCVGSTEQEAKDRAKALWDKERERLSQPYYEQASQARAAQEAMSSPASSYRSEGRGHANTGKLWMHHPEKGYARVVLTEITMYEANGYVRKGPRSK